MVPGGPAYISLCVLTPTNTYSEPKICHGLMPEFCGGAHFDPPKPCNGAMPEFCSLAHGGNTCPTVPGGVIRYAVFCTGVATHGGILA